MKSSLTFIAVLLLMYSLGFAKEKTKPTKRSIVPIEASKILDQANKYYRAGNIKRAVLMYQKSEKRGAPPEVVAFNLGNCYYQAGDLPRAAASFKKAVRLTDYHYVPALTNLGAVLYRLGQYGEAIATYHQLTRIKPKLGSAWVFLAEAYNRTGDYVGAQRALEKARELAPDDVGLIYQLAETFVQQNDVPQAIEVVRKATTQLPEEIDFFFYMGDLYRMSEDYDQAASAYRQGLASDPDRPMVLYKLADVMVLSKQSFLAVDYLQKAMTIKPDFADGAIFLGNLSYDLKWYDRAADAYEKAASLGNEEGIQGLRNLIYEFEQIGDYKQALNMADRAIKLRPQDESLKSDRTQVIESQNSAE